MAQPYVRGRRTITGHNGPADAACRRCVGGGGPALMYSPRSLIGTSRPAGRSHTPDHQTPGPSQPRHVPPPARHVQAPGRPRTLLCCGAPAECGVPPKGPACSRLGSGTGTNTIFRSARAAAGG